MLAYSPPMQHGTVRCNAVVDLLKLASCSPGSNWLTCENGQKRTEIVVFIALKSWTDPVPVLLNTEITV